MVGFLAVLEALRIVEDYVSLCLLYCCDRCSVKKGNFLMTRDGR